MPQRVGILSTGSYLPGDPIPVDQVEAVLGPLPEMPPRLAARVARLGPEVLARAGVLYRHYAIDPETRAQSETNASMGERAIRAALEPLDESPDSIDLLICSSPMADYYCPPTSALIQGRLGIRECTEIEVHSNCTGAPKSLQIALDMLRAGRYRRAAVVYTQLSSAFLRTEFFNQPKVTLENVALRWMLADGAGAMILEVRDEGPQLLEAFVESSGGDREPGMIGGLSGAAPQALDLNGAGIYPALHASGRHHVWQDISEVNRRAPRQLVEGLRRMLDTLGIAGPDVSHFLLGVPGRHFITDATKTLFRELIGANPDAVPFGLEEFGYCGGATIFIQYDRLARSGNLKAGQLVAAYLEESSKWMSGGFVARG